jgi:hypothetical protein
MVFSPYCVAGKVFVFCIKIISNLVTGHFLKNGILGEIVLPVRQLAMRVNLISERHVKLD